MKNAGGPHSCSHQINTDFKLTIIDSRSLFSRLTTELQRVSREVRCTIPELRRDPVGFLLRSLSKTAKTLKRYITDGQLMTGLTSAVLIVFTTVFVVMLFDKTKIRADAEIDNDTSPVNVVMMEPLPPDSVQGGGVEKTAAGRVGLRKEKGEGSGPTPMRSQGGGSGGNHDKTPAQYGAVPQSSQIPAPIPKQPPLNPPNLPVAGVDIDPLLWTDIKYPKYGDPRSQSHTPSNGPGEDGGMGTNRGFGVGEGRDNGFGRGTGGNIGDGPNQRGCCGVGGAPPGPGGGGDRPLRMSEVEQKVRLLSKPEPHYSEEARRSGISGTVVLRVVFTSTGEVTQIRAVTTLPFGLTERAIAAARQIRFIPALKAGRPVSVHMQLEYNFNLY